MAKILYIKASPRGPRSHSVSVTDAFIESYKKRNPGDEVLTIDLDKRELPIFGATAVSAKYSVMHGQKQSGEEIAAWKVVESVIAEFKSADKYVIAVPMWNFGIPYKLKQYIDIIVQPGLTFSFSPESGYKGLVTNKPAFVSYARGGEYPSGSEASALDHQKSYFETILGFIGFTDIRSVIVEPTLMQGPEVAKSKQSVAIEEARRIALVF